MEGQNSLLARLERFFLTRKLVVALMLVGLVAWGLAVAPFAWEFTWLPRDPVPVDAIPDLGDNQQIVFSEWPGRSPQDVEDQVTYPLTTALLGVPGVETIRSSSMFGFSSIYVIFAEEVDFYWSRSRILEKLNSLPASLCPRASSRPWGRTQRPWGRYSGTRWKAATNRARPPAAGICTSCAAFRTGRCAMPCWLPTASARWLPWAASCRNTKSTSTRTRCAPMGCGSTRFSARCACPTGTWVRAPSS